MMNIILTIHNMLKYFVVVNVLFPCLCFSCEWWRDTSSRPSPFSVREDVYGLHSLFPSKELTSDFKIKLRTLWEDCLSISSRRSSAAWHAHSFVYQQLKDALNKADYFSRSKIIQQYAMLFPSIHYGHFDILNVLCSCSNQQFSASVLAQVTDLMEDVSDGLHRKFLGEAIVLCQNNISSLLPICCDYLKSLPSGNDRAQIVLFLNETPPTRQIETFEKIKVLCSENREGFPGQLGDVLSLFSHHTLTSLVAKKIYTVFSLVNASCHPNLFRILRFSPVEHMDTILDHFLGYIRENTMENSLIYYLQRLRLESETLRRSFEEYWIKILTQSPDRELVQNLSSIIINCQYELGIQDDSRAMDEALISSTVLDSDRHYDQNPYRQYDPYRIYKDLLTSRSLIVQIPLSHLPKEIVKGRSICLDTDYFRNLSRLVITQEMLPLYKPTCIKDICTQLEKRMTPELGELIKNEIGMSYEDVSIGSLKSEYLSDLLIYQRASGESIPLTTAKFICIVAHLQKLENSISEEKKDVYLTSQEEGFLKMGASIYSCPYGKRGGIDDFYAVLPQASKVRFASSSLGHEFVETVLRAEVSKMFSGTNLYFQDMIGEKALDILKQPNGAEKIQAIHQALHLKNLIGIDVGLFHTLTFDRNGYILLDSIAQSSKNKTMLLYYRHFLPVTCIDALRREVNQKLQEDNQLYNHLLSLINSVDLDESWEWNDAYQTQLTRYGAIQILLSIGAFRYAVHNMRDVD